MPQTGPKNISEKRLKAALRKHAGIYSMAARELGCDRTNVAQRINRSPALQEFVAGIDEELGDMAEGHIKQAIIKGDLKTIRWWAPLKLRDRGFNPRLEVTGADGAALQVAPVSISVTYIGAQPGPGTEEDVI